MKKIITILLALSVAYLIMCIGSMVSSGQLPFGELGAAMWYIADIVVIGIGARSLFADKEKTVSVDEIGENATLPAVEQVEENTDEIEENVDDAIGEHLQLEEEAPLPSLDILPELDLPKESHEEIIRGIKQQQRERFVQQMRFLIEQEKVYLKAGIKIEEVALTLGTNRTYVSRIVKEVYGHTFADQMNIMRLRSAQQDLLTRRDVSIDTIAMSNGFNSANTFNKVFSQFLHSSPAAWRAAH